MDPAVEGPACSRVSIDALAGTGGRRVLLPPSVGPSVVTGEHPHIRHGAVAWASLLLRPRHVGRRGVRGAGPGSDPARRRLCAPRLSQPQSRQRPPECAQPRPSRRADAVGGWSFEWARIGAARRARRRVRARIDADAVAASLRRLASRGDDASASYPLSTPPSPRVSSCSALPAAA
jgi:hypothetical protein